MIGKEGKWKGRDLPFPFFPLPFPIFLNSRTRRKRHRKMGCVRHQKIPQRNLNKQPPSPSTSVPSVTCGFGPTIPNKIQGSLNNTCIHTICHNLETLVWAR